jgi:hypothetical protein
MIIASLTRLMKTHLTVYNSEVAEKYANLEPCLSYLAALLNKKCVLKNKTLVILTDIYIFSIISYWHFYIELAIFSGDSKTFDNGRFSLPSCGQN